MIFFKTFIFGLVVITRNITKKTHIFCQFCFEFFFVGNIYKFCYEKLFTGNCCQFFCKIFCIKHLLQQIL